ncbi:MAG TPA: hypothetical protein VFE16_02370 [Candidatus Cybelea sp.]|nr:hypothetical protein [Candidatus Cybelea sp.]
MAVRFGRGVLNFLIVALLAGIFAFGLWTLLAKLLAALWVLTANMHADWGNLAQRCAAFLHEPAAIWLSALATIAVFWATRNLTRVTNFALALKGPVLNVDLMTEAPPGPVPPYDPGFQAEDAADPQLGPYVQAGAFTPIYLRIVNSRSEPSAVAGRVKVSIALKFGSTNGRPPHPHVFRRAALASIVYPHHFKPGIVLNVGNLAAYEVVTESVEYYDICDRRRTAAWGINSLTLIPGQALIIGSRIFKPRKGEFSDAHR